MTTINLTVAANVNNYNPFVQAGSPSGVVDVIITVNAGVVIGSATTQAAFRSHGGFFAAGSTVTIINNGSILGRGGNAGAGGSVGFNGQAGSNGGDAIKLTENTTLINNGLIKGGGGGGGGGAGGSGTVGQGGGGGGGEGSDGGNLGAGWVNGTNGTASAVGTGGAGQPGNRGDGGAGGAGGELSGGNPAVPGSDSGLNLGGAAGSAGQAVNLNGFTLTLSNGMTLPLATLTLTALIPTFNAGGGMTLPLATLTLTAFPPVAMGVVATATSYNGAGARGRLSKPPFNEGIPDTLWNWHLKTWRWAEGDSKPEVSKTASFTASDAFLYPVDATAGSIVVTLPKAATMGGKKFVIKKTDSSANTVTVTADTLLPDLVDGSATKVLTAQYDSLVVQADGISRWWKIAASATGGGGGSSPLTTKGDIWGYDTADNRIPIGANNSVLTADSTKALGLKWAPSSGIYYNVMSYGAVGDGVTDDTAAFQAAHDAMVTSGGTVYAPSNTYKIAGTINLSKSMTLLGDGRGSTILSTSSGTADILLLSGVQQRISNIQLTTSVGRSAGAYINCNGSSSRTTIDNVEMLGWYRGITYAGIATLDVSNCVFFNGVATTGIGIDFQTGQDVRITNTTMDNTLGSEPAAGINVQVCGAIVILNCDIIHFINALAVFPGNGQNVASLWCDNSFFDTCTLHGVQIAPTGTGTVYRCRFSNCWTGSCSGGIGFFVNGAAGTIDGIDIVNHHAFLNSSDGIHILGVGTTKNVTIIGGQCAQNGRDGIRASGGTTDFAIIDLRSGAVSGLTGNTGWGINVNNAGSDNYRILGNDTRGNTAGGLQNLGTGTTQIVSNNI